MLSVQSNTAVQAPTEVALGPAVAYYPEMGEGIPDRLFHSEYNFRKTYSLCWKVADDDAARAKLRALRIRPSDINRQEQADSYAAKRLGSAVFSCLITSVAHRKLRETGALAIRLLLD